MSSTIAPKQYCVVKIRSGDWVFKLCCCHTPMTKSQRQRSFVKLRCNCYVAEKLVIMNHVLAMSTLDFNLLQSGKNICIVFLSV